MERFHSDSDRVYWEKASLDLIKADFPTAKITKSPPEKQALNGYIEEGVEAVVNNAKAVMADAPHMPKFLWESALNSTIKQMNKTATAGHPTKTPDERWSGEKPDFTRDVPWGTRCWFVATTTERKKGWDPRWADSGVPGFVVDSDPSGGYWVYNPKTKKIRIRKTFILILSISLNDPRSLIALNSPSSKQLPRSLNLQIKSLFLSQKSQL